MVFTNAEFENLLKEIRKEMYSTMMSVLEENLYNCKIKCKTEITACISLALEAAYDKNAEEEE